MIRRAIAIAVMVVAVGRTTLAQGAPVKADTARLHQALDSLAAAHHGTVGYTVLDLGSGARLTSKGDETFPTASLIKVGVLVTIFDLVNKLAPANENS